jgi:hypothetical protein
VLEIAMVVTESFNFYLKTFSYVPPVVELWKGKNSEYNPVL